MSASIKISRSMARHGECLRRELGPGHFSSSSVLSGSASVTFFLRRLEADLEEEAPIVGLSKRKR